MTIKDFDEAHLDKFKLTFPELLVAYELATAYSRKNEYQRAIKILSDLLANIENYKLSSEDKNSMIPNLYLNIGYFYEFLGNYQQGLKYAQLTWATCKEYGHFRFVHYSLFRIAYCYFHLGEEESFYKPYLLRAYHVACAIGDYENAKLMKEEGEKKFGIVLEV
jgi:tetratricopeptide (TPR) repeat protein